MAYSGPTARQDAENAEKSRWLTNLAVLLTDTPTPLGTRLAIQRAVHGSMVLGLRPGSLRNRVRVVRRFFVWLAHSYQVPFPVLEEHFLDYLALRVQEPCTRNVLKCTHEGFVFLEEVSELKPAEQTHSQTTVSKHLRRAPLSDSPKSSAKAGAQAAPRSVGGN